MTQNPPQSGPAISIVLLVKNGLPTLRDLLESVRRQKIEQTYEILAVDSGSTDGSLEVMKEFGVHVHQIPPSEFRFGPTRQLAFSLARGGVIVTLSQDAVPAREDWLSRMAGPILSNEFDIVVGTDDIQPSDLKYFWARNGLTGYPSVYAHWPLEYRAISCVNLAISREAWKKTGFGDVAMSEDHYLGLMAWRSHLRVRLEREANVVHTNDYDLMRLAKRSFNEGMGGRVTEGAFSFGRMLRVMCGLGTWKRAMKGIAHREIRTFGEATFLIVRPLFLYLGFRLGKDYWR